MNVQSIYKWLYFWLGSSLFRVNKFSLVPILVFLLFIWGIIVDSRFSNISIRRRGHNFTAKLQFLPSIKWLIFLRLLPVVKHRPPDRHLQSTLPSLFLLSYCQFLFVLLMSGANSQGSVFLVSLFYFNLQDSKLKLSLLFILMISRNWSIH